MTAAAISKSLGGPAANVAVMAAGLGDPLAVDCELITSLGDDADSDWALAELAERGVKTIGIRGPGEQRLSRCVVLVEPNGSRTIVNEPFVLEVDSVLPYVGSAEPDRPHCVHLDGFQVEPMARSVAALRQRGLTTSVHTTGLHASWRSEAGFNRLCGLFDLVFLNRDLALEIAGPAPDDETLIARIGRVSSEARRNSAKGLVVLTLGTVGAVAFEARQGPYPRRSAGRRGRRHDRCRRHLCRGLSCGPPQRPPGRRSAEAGHGSRQPIGDRRRRPGPAPARGRPDRCRRPRSGGRPGRRGTPGEPGGARKMAGRFHLIRSALAALAVAVPVATPSAAPKHCPGR